MRILYYSPHRHLRTDRPAGYATHIRETVRAFRRAGQEVRPLIAGQQASGDIFEPGVGTPEGERSRAWTLARSCIPPVLWQTGKDVAVMGWDRTAKTRLADAVATFHPDLIYERGSHLQPSGAVVAREAGVPHILELNAPHVEERRALTGSRSLLDGYASTTARRQLEATDGVVVVSTALRDHLVTKHGVPPEKVLVVPNGVDPAASSVDAATMERVRKQLGLGAGPVVGFVGSIFPWHGVDVLVEAFHSIAGKHPDATLLIVGDGALRQELEALAETRGLLGRALFTGSVPHSDVPAFIACMDVAVLAKSNWYGSPVKLFEYGALGAAIVAVDNGPVRDVMQDGIHGLLTRPSPVPVADAIDRLLSDPGLRTRLGTAFREKVLAEHTWDHNAQAILQFAAARGRVGT